MVDIDYIPQQDVTQRQYFTGIWEYTAQYQTSNVNWIRHKLINQQKTRPAWELNSYQSWYDSFDTWIENYSAFKKREWFISCEAPNTNIVLDEMLYEWNRFYLVTDPRYTKVWIEAECWSSVTTQWCDTFLDGWCKARNPLCRDTAKDLFPSWEESFQDVCIECSNWITKYDFNPCIGQKFTSTYGPKWKPIAFTKWKIRHDIVGNQVFSSVRTDINVPAWSRAYFTFSNNQNIVVWYMRQVKWTYEYSNWTSWIWLEWFHYWLDQWTTDVIKDANWNITNTFKKFSDTNSTYIEEWDVEIWFFSERWNTLTFATANWAVQIHWYDCESYFSTFYAWTHTYTADGDKCNPWIWSNIQSFFTFAWKNWFIKDGWMYIADGANDLAIFTWAAIDLAEEYNDFVEVWQYGYLLWPNSMAILYRAFTNTWQIVYQLITTDNGMWYFNRYSYIKHRGWFYMAFADDTWRPVVAALYVNPFDRWWWYYSFDIGYSIISKWWANQDFHMINKRRWDSLTMSTKNNELLLFANSSWEEELNTKVFIYDTDDKFWHIWNVCWNKIKFYKDGVWFHNIVSINSWKTDWWNEITWVKWFMFGQWSSFSPKWITWIYMSLNYESVITNKSWIRMDMEFDWYMRSKRHPIWSKYISNLNSIKWTWIANEKDIDAILYDNMPMDLILMWGNWFGKPKEVELSLNKDLETFCSYTYKWVKECVTDCLDECKDNTKNNILDVEDNHLFTLAKWVNLLYVVNDSANKIYIEFVDEWTDDISLNWYEVQRQFMQRDNLVHAQNVLTVNNIKKPINCIP